MTKREVYLDNAATTPLSKEVLVDLEDKLQNYYGNPSTLYRRGRQAKQILSESRQTMADSVNADPSEIVFTSGGSESNNTAIIKTAEKRAKLGKHIITSQVEHPSVLNTMHYLETRGFTVTYLPVNKAGQISLTDVQAALDEDTILVSIMTVNNETGAIMPIHAIGELLSHHQAWFHTDAVQAYGTMDINVKKDKIDLLSTSAHKINGPKMTGFLYVNNNIKLDSFVHGGDQEYKRRAGTENVPSIAAFATAVRTLTPQVKATLNHKYDNFKVKITNELKNNHVDFAINGDKSLNGASHILNIWIKGINSAVLQTNLDLEGIAIAGGSACTAGSVTASPVLQALYGKDSARAFQSLRISFGKNTTEDDIDYFIDKIVKIINRLNKKRVNN